MTSGQPPLPDGEDRLLVGEDRAIAEVLAAFEGGPILAVGPGHDCAAVAVGDSTVVVTTDVLVDGVHFDLAAHGAEAAGAKALLVNLSDLAAAAARPLAFEIGVVLPRGADAGLLAGLARGLARVARRWACPPAGGDTNVADGPLVLAVTALGSPGPMGVLTRGGAQPGDVLSVTGALGGSLAGRHLDVTPRLAEAESLAARRIPHACMDLSDGLSRDLPRLARASRVGAEIDAGAVPIHDDVPRDLDPAVRLRHALDDGEDFELLIAHERLDPRTVRDLYAEGVTLVEVGRVVSAVEGIHLLASDGRREDWVAGGFDHLLGATL